MVHSNKVLTVSYGTFSCTLEGFEDSFDTMKAIAEYFRDLAADDRYFGAEPPQPDAEMLARIAQREIARQVEARREGTGFVLRAAEAADTAPVTASVAPAAEAAPATEMETALPSGRPVEDAVETVAEEAAAAQPIADDVTALVETAEEVAEAEAPAESVAEAAEEDVAEASEAPEEGVAEMAAEEEVMPIAETALPEDAPAEAAVAAFMASTVEDEDPAPVAEIIAPVAPAAAPSADSIAAKLQRIRAVVSRNEQAAASASYDEDYAEDQPAAGFATEETPDLSGILEEVAAAEDDTLTEAREPETPQAEASEVELAEVDLAAADLAESEALFDDLDADLAEEDTTEDAVENILRDAEEAEAVEEAGIEDIADEDLAAEAPEETIEEAPGEDTAEMLRQPATQLPPGTLSPEDEADLIRELAEVEAELRGDHADLEEDIAEEDDTAEVALAEEEPLDAAEDAPLVLSTPETVKQPQSDLSRLMAAADARLDDPEATSTRETYSHLRAAVAATEAESSAGGLAADHPDAEAYRDDLARVVHPRRPVLSGGERRRRPGGETGQRPAPLKLVAEQRVDDMAPAAAERHEGPVRPRRVAAAHETPRPVASPTGGFAQFAHDMGVTELPELLEAAAAYMQFVEGREQFTRPQLIHKAREASVEEFNREDGLRSFGVLLREGKIVKKDPGRFVASGEIGFQPASSRAAG